MTLPRDEIEKGLSEELSALSALVRPLTAQQLTVPTRCEGWTVGDVAAHVAGSLADIVAGRLEGLGTPEVTQRQVDERRGRRADELANELDAVSVAGVQLLSSFDDAAWEGAAPAGLDMTLGFGVEALWYDTFVHADDIRHALGRPGVSSEAIRASVSHIAGVLGQQGWGPATLRLDGIEAFAVRPGDGGSGTAPGAGDRTVTGDPMAFVLAGTGRTDPATIGLDETVNIYR